MPAPDRTLRALGLRARQLREALGLNQETLGEKAQLDQTYISGIERGVRNPTVKVLGRLAKALKVSLAELFTGMQP
jgi:transcriptional regulator with XRE-family HTH domain